MTVLILGSYKICSTNTIVLMISFSYPHNLKQLTEVITRIESNKNLLIDSVSLVKNLYDNMKVSQQESTKRAFEVR